MIPRPRLFLSISFDDLLINADIKNLKRFSYVNISSRVIEKKVKHDTKRAS